jgi:hypothetical protein
MKLELMLRPGMVERYSDLRAPIPCARRPKHKEHSLEERAPLIAAIKLIRRNI